MTNINGRYHYSRVKFSMRYRHSNNYTQKWLKKIIMIIRFHNRTEYFLYKKVRHKEKNKYIYKSKYIRKKKKKRKNTKLIREQMTSGLKMICLIRIYTSYRIQRFGAGDGSNGTRLKASN